MVFEDETEMIPGCWQQKGKWPKALRISLRRLPDCQQTCPPDALRGNPVALWGRQLPSRSAPGGQRGLQDNYRGSVRRVRATAGAALLRPLGQGGAEAEGLVHGVHLIATGCNGRERSSE